MANEKTYNGWTNYETWCVNLWIDNDQGLAESVRDLAINERDTYALSKEIEALIDSMHPFNGDYTTKETQAYQCSLWADLLGAALSEVDWYDIAEHWIADTQDDIETDQDNAQA